MNKLLIISGSLTCSEFWQQSLCSHLIDRKYVDYTTNKEHTHQQK